MPEQFRALIVILGLTLPVFWLAHRPACELAIGDADFRRRRNLWVAITVLAFLAHDFWIYVAVSAVMLAMAAPRDSNRDRKSVV